MTLLFYIGHPAHFHNFSVVSENLRKRGHNIIIAARDKDVLFNLLEGSPYKVYKFPARTGKGKPGLIISMLKREWLMFNICRKESPNLLIGTDPVITHIGKLLKIPTLLVNEDDAAAVPLFDKWANKYADYLLAPESCDVGKYQHKKISYSGYQELAYLHPDHFTPDKKKVQHLIKENKPYYLLRFSGLTAHHDKGVLGLHDELATRIIEKLEKNGNVYITSERPLSKELESYRIQLDPKDMHHALYFANMFIGDSQTMTAEAAVLGTPSLRINDFVGRLGYLEELEHRYYLTKGFKPTQSEELLNQLEKWLNDDGLENKMVDNRKKMLDETINTSLYWEWIIDNFPESINNIRKGVISDKTYNFNS